MSNKRPWIVLGLLGLLVVAGVVVAVCVQPDDEISQAAEEAKPKRKLAAIADLPKIDEQTPEQTVEMLASEEFADLSPDRKEAYYQELIDTSEGAGEERRASGMRAFFQASQEMEEAQKERLEQNARELGMAFMERRLDEYFALSQEEKNAHLDSRIDQFQQWRERAKSQESSGEGGGRRGGGRHQRFTPEHLDRLIQTIPAERRAKFSQYHQDMRDRMEERGINTDW